MYYKTTSSGRRLNKLFKINDFVEILFCVYLIRMNFERVKLRCQQSLDDV
jgi:hypothetical protein